MRDTHQLGPDDRARRHEVVELAGVVADEPVPQGEVRDTGHLGLQADEVSERLGDRPTDPLQ